MKVRGLTAWCQTVAANLDTLTYDERRLALTALGVQVRVWQVGATGSDGESLPRWQVEMKPAPSSEPIVLRPARAAIHNTPLVTLRWTDRDETEPVALAAD